MKKTSGLIGIAILCCFAAMAQQASESTDSITEVAQTTKNSSDPAFVNFSAVVKDLNKVWLQWTVDRSEAGDYFIIERGTDENHFETIGVLRKSVNSDRYELTDIAPPNGIDLYRIRYTGRDGRVVFSKALQVSLSGDIDFKFYPNPVDKLLIIRSQHIMDMQVVDAGGSVRLSKRLQAGIQVINISFLEKGVYILRVADKESNRIVSNQLLKN